MSLHKIRKELRNEFTHILHATLRNDAVAQFLNETYLATAFQFYCLLSTTKKQHIQRILELKKKLQF